MKLILTNLSLIILIIFGATNLSLFALFIGFDICQAFINLSLCLISFTITYLFTNLKN